jgi:FkbM family methyltransferase
LQKNVFTFLGRRIELWTHPEPDHLATIIRSSGRFYEPDVLMKVQEIYLPGTTIVDVGANIGNHTVFFAAVLGAPVIAVEPFGPNHELLEVNITANGLGGLVRPHCLALGARDGNGTTRIGDATNFGTVSVVTGSGEIVVRSLDGLLLQHPPQPIGLIKIDVEGSEAGVLAGARQTILRWQPDIVIEADGTDRFLATARQLLDLGYAPRGRYAWTPTYLFSAVDQAARLQSLLEPLAVAIRQKEGVLF